MIKFAKVLLVSTNGDVLMELLKAAPGASSGDPMVLFGGEVTQGEMPRETASRTVLEQTGVDVALHALKFCGTYYQKSEGYEVFLFAVENIGSKNLRPSRGGRIVSVDASSNLIELKINDIEREMIRDFYANANKKPVN